MQYINACECYSEPLDLWNDDVYRENTRMSKEEQCLILEMLKRKRPSRILEVGVFAGGGDSNDPPLYESFGAGRAIDFGRPG